jgi:hypothetical protein
LISVPIFKYCFILLIDPRRNTRHFIAPPDEEKLMRLLIAAALLMVSITASANDFVVGFSPCWAGRVCALDVVIQAINVSACATI